MSTLELIGEIIGMKATKYIAFIILGISLTFAATNYVTTHVSTPEQVDQKIAIANEQNQKERISLQIQIYENSIISLNNELYQLKKLKNARAADDDDIDRLNEVKRNLESIRAKKDSLQNIIIKLK